MRFGVPGQCQNAEFRKNYGGSQYHYRKLKLALFGFELGLNWVCIGFVLGLNWVCIGFELALFFISSFIVRCS